MDSAIERMQQKREDPRSTEELIQLALNEKVDDEAWKPVVFLHYRGSAEVLEQARTLCLNSNARERELGANILGQLGVPERTFPEECFQILAGMLANERDPNVLESIAIAYGHLHDERAIKLLVPLKHHPDADVRLGLVHGITGHEDDVAIETLIELSSDKDEDIRDWATFALGTMIRTDTSEIRESLLARISDSDDNVRGEALVGLARRKDDRILDALIAELTSEQVVLLAIEAAEELGDPRLGPALLMLRDKWGNEEDRHVAQLDRALLSCLPHGNS